eukprot:5041975-Prymnesium_polylepis.1
MEISKGTNSASNVPASWTHSPPAYDSSLAPNFRWKFGEDDNPEQHEGAEGFVVEHCNWACCDRCEKWRRLPSGDEYATENLPDQWFCELNPGECNSCDTPEERMGKGEKNVEGIEEVQENDEDEDEDDEVNQEGENGFAGATNDDVDNDDCGGDNEEEAEEESVNVASI